LAEQINNQEAEIAPESGGNSDESTAQLLPQLYEELRLLAETYLSNERADHTLQPTALVHEAYLRLVGNETYSWENRAHFFGAAARAMRRILVNHAVARQRVKRGGGRLKVALDEQTVPAGEPDYDVIALDQALGELVLLDPRKCTIVELRFFGGLTVKEIALLQDISPATVKREWALAKTWLYSQIMKRDSVDT